MKAKNFEVEQAAFNSWLTDHSSRSLYHAVCLFSLCMLYCRAGTLQVDMLSIQECLTYCMPEHPIIKYLQRDSRPTLV